MKKVKWETHLSPVLTIQDRVREAHLVRRRARVALALSLVTCIGLGGRVFDLQVLEFEHFRTLSESNRVSLVAVPPTRGLIYDRNGVVLAQNTPTYSLEITPEAVQDMDVLIGTLSELVEVDDADLERFYAALAKARRFDSVPLRFRLSTEEVARFAVNRPFVPGADFKARLARTYPHGPLAAHLVGYVGRIDERDRQSIDVANYRGTNHIGKTGVEHYYESVLHGRAGYEHIEINAFGRTLRVLERRDPVPGSDIYLTIDAGLQAVAEEALGERSGSVVAIEPSSGAVLAFVSVPTFDPNLFAYGIGHQDYRELLHSLRRPLFNRALNGQYPPGSTIKPIMALAGLEADVDTASQGSYCGGWYSLPDSTHRYRDWKKGGHGELDLSRAIVESCDVFFYRLALDLGIERMHGTFADFGFGSLTGVDLSGESSGLAPSRAWKEAIRGQPWYPGETLITGIGQGYMLATPLQLASAAAALGTRWSEVASSGGSAAGDGRRRRRQRPDSRDNGHHQGRGRRALDSRDRGHGGCRSRRPRYCEAGGCRRRVPDCRQDRHRPGDRNRSERRLRRRRDSAAPSRSRTLSRFRSGETSANRGGDRGGERRKRQRIGRAHRPAGDGLLPDG